MTGENDGSLSEPVIYTGLVKDFEPMLGTEVLVTVWQDGSVEVAFRGGGTSERWGPPTSLTREE